MLAQYNLLRYRNLLLAICCFMLLFVISCNRGANEEAKRRIPMALFSGEWVKADYRAAVIRLKSPYKAHDKLNGIVAMLIDTADVHGDSLAVTASWNNHEGYAFHIIARAGHNASSFLTDIGDFEDSTKYYELGYRVGKADTVIVLYHFDSRHSLLDSTIFNRSGQIASGDAGGPIQYIVNKYLFAANYISYDSLAAAGNVTLDVNGNSKGISDYTSYNVGTDFMGPETMDYVTFGNKEHKYKTYIFDFVNDTLKLYEAIEDSTEQTRQGALKYLLKRQ